MSITDPIAAERRLSWLSARERHVLAMMMRGLSAEQIAAHDFVAVSTVRTQIRFILQKLGCTTQLQAVALTHQAMWGESEWSARFAEIFGRAS